MATDVKVEFDKLKAENSDVIGWIRFDNQDELGINYPILYSGDNQKYLRTDLHGNSHIAECIFLEGLNKSDFSDYYNIIYGHNMNDGSMFGSLKNIRMTVSGKRINTSVDTGVKPQTSNKILTLSTCTGNGYSKRLAIHAVCVDVQTTDESKLKETGN